MSFFSKKYHPPGTAPGTLTEAESPASSPANFLLVDYTDDQVFVERQASVEQCIQCLANDTVTWVHVEGAPTEAALKHLGTAFGLHPLALEDVVNSGQRPKVEAFEDQLFIVLALPEFLEESVYIRQVSLFVGERFVISFLNDDLRCFEPIIDRLNNEGSRIRRKGADFLVYSLVDMVIDHGFPVLEQFGTQLEEVEEEIMAVAQRASLEKIHILKRELILLRRMLWPHREVVNHLLREDSRIIREESLFYFRDCYDHAIQIMDLLETYRDVSGSMLEIYLSNVSNRMNEVMRVLTVIATLFIPMTFVAGVYGMNFDRTSPWNMPELDWPYGYFAALGIMFSMAIAMLVYFRRKGWF